MKHFFLSITSCTLLAVMLCTTACSKSVDASSGNPGGGTGGPGGGGDSSATYVVNVSTIAGKLGQQGDADGYGTSARFWNPTKMVYDNRNKTLYVADGTVIRSIDENNNVKTYLPYGKVNNWDEILDMDVTKDAAGGSLFFITKQNTLYKIEPNGNTYKLTIIAEREYGGDELGTLNSADHFDLASGLSTAPNGDIYFFNQSWYTLHHIAFNASSYSGIVKSFAGKPSASRAGDCWPFADGQGENATFSYGVSDMCTDGSGNFYVADFGNDLVRKVTASGVVTSLFQYKHGLGFDDDGPVSTAQSNRVTNVTAKQDGSMIFFTSYGIMNGAGPALRVVVPGKNVTTLAGSGYSYGDGKGSTAVFGEIGGIACTPDGKTVYVSEIGNKVIRKVTIQ